MMVAESDDPRQSSPDACDEVLSGPSRIPTCLGSSVDLYILISYHDST